MKEFDEFEDFEDGNEQSIDLMPYVRLLLSKWKTILLWAFVGAVIGIIIGISTPKTYSTRVVVAPELATRSTVGSGLSSLASLAGINMNSLALTDAMHPDLYPEIIKSTDFFIGLFDLPVTVATKDSLVHTDLYDYMVNYNKAPWWGYILGFPGMLKERVKGWFVPKDDFDDSEGHEHIDSIRLTKQQEGVIKSLSKKIKPTVEKKTFVLSVRITMQDPVIAAQVGNAIIERLRTFVIDYRTANAQKNVDYFEELYDETRQEYIEAQREYARYVDSHQGILSRSELVRQKHLEAEAQLHYQMYSQTAQNLLTAKAKVQQEAPVLVVIQPGRAPHYGKPAKAKLAILWFILGGGLRSAWLIFKKRKEEK